MQKLTNKSGDITMTNKLDNIQEMNKLLETYSLTRQKI